jgi:predicted membrane-bound mannosyltransferase
MPAGDDFVVSASPSVRHPDRDEGTAASVPARLANAVAERGITVEQLLWIALLLAAIATRFWNLDYRTLHHDEGIHTYYSWFFSTGETPYRHDPLSHGPFLFHANALVYFLFGGTDATSRFMPALVGVLIVGAPWLLRSRRFLGRWGALAAGFMFLISPSFLYYTRYIRHDPYTCIGALALLIAIFRYIEKPERRWMLLAFFAVAFMLTNHEIVFAILLVFVGTIFVTLLGGALRPVLPVVLAAGGAGIALLVARRVFEWEPLPEIPWDNPTDQQQTDYYEALLSNPFVIGVLLIGILFMVGIVLGMRESVPRKERRDGYLQSIFGHSAPGSLERGVFAALSDPFGLIAGALMAIFLFLMLFTTLFTNVDGVATSTFSTEGTLLYWLGQQGERRGSQPWFYFVTESFQYEWLAIVFCTAACIWVGVRLARALIRREADDRLFFQVFVVAWFGFLFAVLSWAGEKMPWLIMHFTLPAILIGAVLINELVEGAIAWHRTHRSAQLAGFDQRTFGAGVVILLVIVAVAWFFEAARLTYGAPGTSGAGIGYRDLPAWALDEWWILATIPVFGLAVIVASALVAGIQRTAYLVITATFVIMSMYQMHAGFRVAYLDGDIATDTLIYNTTSPDVKQMDEDLAELSLMEYGDNSMPIGYDHCTAWPLTWYFRDNPGAYQLSQSQLSNPAGLPPVVIGVTSSWDPGRGCYMPDQIDGYTAQTYAFRWHEPESLIYRNFAIAPELAPSWSIWQQESNPHGVAAIAESVFNSIATQEDPSGEQRLFRLMFFRELPDGLNTYRYRIYVRNDLLPLYNEIRYGN